MLGWTQPKCNSFQLYILLLPSYFRYPQSGNMIFQDHISMSTQTLVPKINLQPPLLPFRIGLKDRKYPLATIGTQKQNASTQFWLSRSQKWHERTQARFLGTWYAWRGRWNATSFYKDTIGGHRIIPVPYSGLDDIPQFSDWLVSLF